MAEGEGGFSDFHTYVCGAFLSKWSADLRKMEFQEILLFLQSPPTTSWALDDIEVLLSEAYLWKCLFHNAGKHLSSASHIPIVKNNKL